MLAGATCRLTATIPIPTPARYPSAGHYPRAYRITWDPQAREYRVALTQLVKRD